ncbi:putative quorum-sensing-regulated virulence factor [Psychrobacter cibarius]|uniref:putative quorum-sensing-regulated virulence factor n=1 Tax=Psychrobacter cibarius TaxID=282669 RepID=UPI003FD51CDC
MTDTALIIDTETDQGRDPRPIQVATINAMMGFEWMKYFNSGRSISPAVTRIHGITDEDVAGLERFDLESFELPQYLIGHNVRFDWRVIGSPSTKLICTVRLARVAFPEWSAYGQSKCIEQLLGKEEASRMTIAAHDALGDARMCYLLYQACCERLAIAPTDFAAVHAIANKANPVSKMPFGKHRGTLIKDVPISYVKWMLGNIHNMQPSLYSALTKRIKAENMKESIDESVVK